MIVPLMAPLLLMQADAKPAPLKCEIGPIERDYGGTHWIVYSCDDAKTIVVVSAAGNPAAPFVFIVSPEGDHYKVYGEGNGDKGASDRAGDALHALGNDAIRQLISETQTARPAK